MNFNLTWTRFALEAEYDQCGMVRIASAHNALRKEHEDLRYTFRELVQRIREERPDLLNEDAEDIRGLLRPRE